VTFLSRSACRLFAHSMFLLLPAFIMAACGKSGGGGRAIPVWSGLNDSSWGINHLQRARYGSGTGGGISRNRGSSELPSMKIDAFGNPVVAWCDDTSGNRGIYVLRWNGSAWVEVGTGSASGGGISNNVGDSSWPSLALDASGYPIVVWNDVS
jgi:hypothetical protein